MDRKPIRSGQGYAGDPKRASPSITENGGRIQRLDAPKISAHRDICHIPSESPVGWIAVIIPTFVVTIFTLHPSARVPPSWYVVVDIATLPMTFVVVDAELGRGTLARPPTKRKSFRHLPLCTRKQVVPVTRRKKLSVKLAVPFRMKHTSSLFGRYAAA